MSGKRIELHEGPDERGRYRFTLYWLADYHPGALAGEYGLAERGQAFHGRLPIGIPIEDKRGGRR